MPKLTGGQLAEGVRRRSEACRQNVLARVNVLRRLMAADTTALKFAEHFSSFGALCAWEAPEVGITPLSPKTVRSHMEYLYDGGHEKFLIDAAMVTQSFRPGIKSRAASEKFKSQRRVEAIMLTTQRYSDLLDRFTKIGLISSEARQELAKHFRLFGDVVNHLREVK